MNIIYGFSNCSYAMYDRLMQGAKVMILQQAQKYHSLMAKGLAECGAEVECISGLPVNRSLTRSLWIAGGNDEENGVRYHYFGSPNLPGLRQLVLIAKAFWRTLTTRNKEVAVCDILNISILIGMLAACGLRRLPIVGIVTDVPGHLAIGKLRVQDRINAWLMRRMDAYVLLTAAMNEVVNPAGKPSTVIEGQVDSSMSQTDNALTDKDSPKVVMYAGSMQRIYGLPELVKAFLNADIAGWELHVYGDGNYREEYESQCKRHNCLKYKGIKPNKEIVAAECRASLLVNPRPTDEDFTKYSFPSKNMEYMASGTPILTTRLPGMPDDYVPYVYIIGDESVDGMTSKLREVLGQPAETLHEKGIEAKRFVIENKNEKVQAHRVLNLAQELLKRQ